VADRTSTPSFGSGRRESHDASAFYERFRAPIISEEEEINRPHKLIDQVGVGRCFVGNSSKMAELPDNSIALVVTSPPYFVGKDYELAVANDSDDSDIPKSYLDYLQMLRDVFSECVRVLEPGGRIAINIANLGRKPYRSLSSDVVGILQDDLGLLLRGEVIWEKSKTSSGSCAWGSFTKASNPVIRDMTERVIIASKGRFDRAQDAATRISKGLPHVSTLSNDEFMDATTDVWQIDPVSAKSIGHPAPYPIELPLRIINLYTYENDLVLDPFCGSGSTLIASANSGRIGIGFDLDEKYAEMANVRLNQEAIQYSKKDRYSASTVAKKKVKDLAEAHLLSQGMSVSQSTKLTKSSNGVGYDFHITDPDGKQSWVEVAGSFAIGKSGKISSDEVLKILGRASLAKQSKNVLQIIVLVAEYPADISLAGKYLKEAVESGLIELELIKLD